MLQALESRGFFKNSPYNIGHGIAYSFYHYLKALYINETGFWKHYCLQRSNKQLKTCHCCLIVLKRKKIYKKLKLLNTVYICISKLIIENFNLINLLILWEFNTCTQYVLIASYLLLPQFHPYLPHHSQFIILLLKKKKFKFSCAACYIYISRVWRHPLEYG